MIYQIYSRYNCFPLGIKTLELDFEPLGFWDGLAYHLACILDALEEAEHPDYVPF
jgi:hypothetical protein